MSRTRLALLALALVLTAYGVVLTGPDADAAAPAPTCAGRRATIVGTAAGDFLTGTPGDDVIVGRGGDDQIRGRGGDDVICGGDGADRISGDGGDDRLDGGRDRISRIPGRSWFDGDVLSGGGGDDRLDVGTDPRRTTGGHRNPDAVSYETAARGVRIDLAGGKVGTARGEGRDRIVVTSALGVIGSAHDDGVTGSAHDDHVTGNAGDDVIRTGAGDDVVYAETWAARPGDDTVDLGAGDDLVVSASGRDRLVGGPGADAIEVSGAEPVRLDGGSGDDTVTVTASRVDGSDVRGGDGSDLVLLRAWGAPLLALDLRVGALSFAGGDGTIGGFEEHHLTGDAAYRVHGTPGPDRFVVLTGGAIEAWTYGGDDFVGGSELDDLLDLGDGTDEAYGVAGSDTCVGVEAGDC